MKIHQRNVGLQQQLLAKMSQNPNENCNVGICGNPNLASSSTTNAMNFGFADKGDTSVCDKK